MIRKTKISMMLLLLVLLGGGATAQSLTVLGGTTFRVESGTTVTVTGDVTNGGTIDNEGAIELTGDFTNNGTLTSGSSSTVEFNGSSAQGLGGSSASTFNDLTIDNSSGVSVSDNDVTVGGVLSLTNGILAAGSQTVVVSSTGSVSRTNGWVTGELEKPVGTGNPSVTFEVGNGSNYTPAALSFSGVSNAGSFTASVVPGEHPNLGDDGCFDTSKRVDQYWSLSNSGVSPVSYDASFDYTSGELVGSPTASNFGAGVHSGSWTYPTLSGTPTGTQTSVTGLTGVGDVAIAEKLALGTPSAITISAGFDPLCQLTNGTTQTTYATSATNATGYTWSLSNPSAGSIDGSGVMTWANGFSGSVDIQVVAENCFGSSSMVTRTVTVSVCGPEPFNGQRSNAYNISSYTLGSCLSLTGDVTLAQPSPEANSSVITGEDVWYKFVAAEPGIRIEVASSSFDGVIELQTAGGTTLESENIVAGTGTEILNHYNPMSPLVPGQTYYVAVRNYDSGQGTGTFTICLQRIADSGCNSGPGPYTSCNTFKAVSTMAQSYTFTFTNTTTLDETVVNSVGSTVIPLSSLVPGYQYTVGLAATFNLADGGGNQEVIIIDEPNSCTITMLPHADLDLRAIDQCPPTGSARARNAVIGSNTWLCGAYRYEWKFTPVPSGLEFSALAPPTNRFIALGTVPQIVAGATYDVQIRPLFGNVGQSAGDYGSDYQCLQIIGPGGLTQEGDNAMADASDRSVSMSDELSTSLYPNPSNGNMINLNITGVKGDQVSVRILDGTGRVVYTDRYTVDGSINKIINFARPLSSGLYMMEMMVDGDMITERFVVSK
jgi:hypothetical protein